MSRKTPKSPATGGHEERNEGPVGGTKGGSRWGDEKLPTGSDTSEDQSKNPPARSASSGFEDTRKLQGDPTGIPFEEPDHPYDGITTRSMDEEAE